MDELELLQLELKQELLKEELEGSSPEVNTEQKPVTFEDNLLSWMASGGRTPPPYYDESEVEGQVSPTTFETFQKFINSSQNTKHR